MVRPPLPSPWRGSARNIVLFVLTLGSVYLAGGFRMVAGLMSILLAHEMGHYLACRYYRIDASLPYFIPFPLSIAGTFGAFIRIREPFPNRKILFDVGIAGPLAGFVVCLPVLVMGLLEATLMVDRPELAPFSLGEPLLFRWATAAVLGPLPEGQTLVLGPLGMAAWFGLLVTALNLVPVGQLDGGHVTYAILRGRAHIVARLGLAAALVLVLRRPTWLLWAVLILVLSRRHPRTLDDALPLGRGRVMVGLLGAGVLAVCFTPDPFYFGWSDLFELMGSGVTGR